MTCICLPFLSFLWRNKMKGRGMRENQLERERARERERLRDRDRQTDSDRQTETESVWKESNRQTEAVSSTTHTTMNVRCHVTYLAMVEKRQNRSVTSLQRHGPIHNGFCTPSSSQTFPKVGVNCESLFCCSVLPYPRDLFLFSPGLDSGH